MAYIIRNLGKKNKDVILEISWNHKNYYLELIKKNASISFSYNTSKTSVFSKKVTNYKTTVTIPEIGFWQLLVRKEVKEKKSTEVFYKLLVTVVK